MKRQLDLQDQVGLGEKFEVRRVRAILSNSLIRAAALATRAARAAESSGSTASRDERFKQIQSLATTAVVSAAASLEARINEFCADALECPEPLVSSGLNPTKVELVGKMWALKVPRTASFSILEKYEIAALLMDGMLDKSKSAHEDALLLTKLRNKLVHFEPEWTPAGDEVGQDPQKLERQLGNKFETNLLAGTGDPFFPGRCLGAGCAAWATKSAIALVDLFYSGLGVASPIDSIRAELATDK